MVDLVARLSTHYGEDMCYFSFQQLLPPNARTAVAGKEFDEVVAKGDMEDFLTLAYKATTEMAKLSGKDKHGGAVVYGGCTPGVKAASAYCKSAESDDWYRNISCSP